VGDWELVKPNYSKQLLTDFTNCGILVAMYFEKLMIADDLKKIDLCFSATQAQLQIKRNEMNEYLRTVKYTPP
jgi:hypothetical protein